jgi:NTP pyrophosphatase (non-canonical NTP hydrolase)
VNELIDKCSQWSIDRQIIQNGNRETQCLKLVSEMGELADNIAKGRDVYDDIGDCLVVLNNLALMHNTTLEQCLAHAYNDIKDRKGYMNEKGVFIKEGDK